ncbi:hypothetical protein [Ferruginibacter sp.]
MTYQEEIHVINAFFGLYKNFLIDKLEHPDSPDFIMTTDSKKIGIELTQIVHSQNAKQLSSEEINFTDLVLKKLVHLLPFNFSISIDLFTNKGVSKAKRENISTEVANFCANEFLNLEDTMHASVEHVETDLSSAIPFVRDRLLGMGLRNLPEGIKSINLFRYDLHGSSFNSQSEAAVIPEFSKKVLDDILNAKEIKLRSYKPCDEYWLIIWQGGGITGYFKGIEFDIPISSTFDKVFILRSAQNDLVILKP